MVSPIGMLVRREGFASLGGFDEALPADAAAADLCLRLARQGTKVTLQPASMLVDRSPADASRARSCALPQSWCGHTARDCDAILFAEGMALHTTDLDGGPVHRIRPLRDAAERGGWQRVVDLQQQIAERGVAATTSVLEDAAGWPNDPAVLAWLAGLCEEAGAGETAAAYWSQLLTCEESAVARRALARIALEIGSCDVAEEHLDALARRRPTDPDGAMMRGVLELQRRRYAAARDAFAIALETGASRGRALRGLGMAALGLDQPEHAWALLDEALGESPDDADGIHWLLRAGCALQRWDALVPRLERYLEIKPDDAAVRFALAGVELRRGGHAAARAHYDRMRAAAPDFDGLDDLRRALAAALPPQEPTDALGAGGLRRIGVQAG
jgi:tetratricopeptide (TPR) repeat protein